MSIVVCFSPNLVNIFLTLSVLYRDNFFSTVSSASGLANHDIISSSAGKADIQTKVDELEALNQAMRDRDKIKDDAIAHLSDRLMVLSTRLQEIERRQQLI